MRTRSTALTAAILGASIWGCVPSYGTSTDASAPDADASARDAGADVLVDVGSPRDVGSDAQDAGSDAQDAADSGNRCKGNSGPAMVRFDATASYSFCIDTTEVTRAQFNMFLDDPARSTVFPAGCILAYEAGVPDTIRDPSLLQTPMGDVSYCDAFAYCAWAGKRLCGKIGGGMAEGNGAGSNEWVYACISGSGSAYPYGSSYDPSACNTEGDAGNGPLSSLLVPVGSRPACHGVGAGYAQLFDMSGNAAEYDSYIGPVDPDSGVAYIQGRGGAVTEGALGRCDHLGNLGQYNRSNDALGFRCCADVTP